MPPLSDDSGYEAFYRETFEWLARAMRPRVGASAEDVAQDALLVVRQRWDEVRRMDRPEAWVRRVAIRMSGRLGRRERDRERLDASTEPPSTAPVPDLDLIATLRSLPDRHAAAIRSHHLEDRSVAQVAEMLGCTEGATKVLLLRARRVLAERMTGLTGRWVSERRWTPDEIARHIRAAGWGSQVEAVLDEDMGGRGGRWELTIADGAYVLLRDDGVRFDHGASRVDGRALQLAPELNDGRARYGFAIDGRSLSLRHLDTTLPPTRGVPDEVWNTMLFEQRFVRD